MQSQWYDLNKLPEIIPTEIERTEKITIRLRQTRYYRIACADFAHDTLIPHEIYRITEVVTRNANETFQQFTTLSRLSLHV